MKDNYFNFIIGLQHSAQHYFDENSFYFHNISHDWCKVANNIFMVRDFETNELIYDSPEHLITDLLSQGIRTSQLIPFRQIFSHLSADFKQYHFATDDYPLAVFLGQNHSFALLKINHEKVKPLSISYDPRDFSGFPSSQNYDKYLLFTLIKLDQKQLQTITQFNLPLNWQTYYEQLSSEVLNPPFNFKKDLSLTLVNNLSLHHDSYDYDFLKHPSTELNLAFALINKIESTQDEIDTEISRYLQDRSSNSSYINEHYSQINDYQDLLNEALVKLISHTANDYENAYIDEQFKPISKLTIQSKVTQENLNNETENLNDRKEQTMSPLPSFLYLIVFLAITIGLLYGVFWLVSHYEFAKFTVMAILILFFLALFARK
ncbi:hypothetical protein [Acinetobacter tianfuensis]|uniref:Uncharacterized protein n=1 Tax=Acinetobacter tianfuensis TaxID=2419603 RepID=A0A3A8ERB3_9GAMM|nr:hypothetical protein [Acinetobacter tianfuensis]RKG33280.1 hypothetical protein D7V32_03925 [Acinetobacter tianfuensis]